MWGEGITHFGGSRAVVESWDHGIGGVGKSLGYVLAPKFWRVKLACDLVESRWPSVYFSTFFFLYDMDR